MKNNSYRMATTSNELVNGSSYFLYHTDVGIGEFLYLDHKMMNTLVVIQCTSPESKNNHVK